MYLEPPWDRLCLVRAHNYFFLNFVITTHQGLFTREALSGIADTTPAIIAAFEQGRACANEVTAQRVLK